MIGPFEWWISPSQGVYIHRVLGHTSMSLVGFQLAITIRAAGSYFECDTCKNTEGGMDMIHMVVRSEE